MNNIRCDTEKRTVSICIKRPDKMIVAQFEFESAEKMNQFLDLKKYLLVLKKMIEYL